MDQETFEQTAQDAFDALPQMLQERIENVHIVIEDVPSPEIVRKMKLANNSMLLGLYEGIPLSRRGTHYGAFPVVPDKITLYKRNIERVAGNEEAIRSQIRDVLIHELAHHYGMNEEEVRNAGY